MKRPIEIPERPRVRSNPQVQKPAEERQHRGFIFSDGRPLTGGRTHYQRPDHFDNVGVSSVSRTPLYIAGSTFRVTQALPSTVSDSPRRRAPSPSATVTKSGRKFIAPPSNGNPTEHTPAPLTPRTQSPARGLKRSEGPKDNLSRADMTPQRSETPNRGMRISGAPPVFIPEPFKPRPYSPQLRRVEGRTRDSGDILTFDPTHRPTTPGRVGLRTAPQVRTYDFITGQDIK
jgi:hypothetical protein